VDEVNEEMPHKIAIVGLANAGKTSIIKSLLQEFEILGTIKPTVGIEHQQVTLFGQTLVFWDFGGQETYRKRYLQSVDRYFPDMHTLFYVVDILDVEHLEESISYFEQVLNAIKTQNNDVRINILFHKWDPVVIDPEERKSRDATKMRFLNKALMLIPDEIPARIFETSIFRPLSIINAISIPLFSKDGINEQMNLLLTDLVQKYQFIFGILFTENFFELGRYFPQSTTEDSLKEGIMGFFTSFKNKIHFNPNFTLDCKTYQLIATKIQITQRNQDYPVILVIGYDNKSKIEKTMIEPTIKELHSEINKLFINIPMATIV
jgi:small GTP-binding protein